jgi:rhodanese-related sulfurtransferase
MRKQKMQRSFRRAVALVFLPLLLASSLGAQSQFKTIDATRLHAMVVDNAYKLEGGRPTQYTVIDTRAPDKYDEGHIFSAVNIQVCDLPLGTSALPQDPGAPIVVYGDGEIGDSRIFVTLLAQAGYTNVLLYPEPFSVWKENHLPVIEPKPERQ